MSEKFDEFSKHLAAKHTRRGAFKLFAAGLVGAAGATFFGKSASATPKFNGGFNGGFNGTFPQLNGTFERFPQFNQVMEILEEIAVKVEKKSGIKFFFPWLK